MQVSQEQAEKILLIFAIALIMYAQSSADSSSCGENFSTRMDQDVFSKHRLRSRVIESQPISRPLECYIKCMKNCRCLSYNICNGGKLCELNSEKKENNVSLFEESHECDYHEYDFSKQQSSGCSDPCCSTSQPCLNGGRCQATCMENGRRVQCICAEGQSGDRCENVARSCAHYSKSTNRTAGLRLIYAPDNTPYRAFCYFDQWSAQTLAVSYSRDNIALFNGKPLTTDYPVSEDSHNWEKYRLSQARMSALLDEAQEWKIACSYQLQGMHDQDSLKVYTDDVDPLVVTGGYCVRVPKIRILGQGCDECSVRIAQGSHMWHMSFGFQKDCDHLADYVNVVPNKACGPRYFNNYKSTCFNEQFSCTSSGDATTQFWFIHNM